MVHLIFSVERSLSPPPAGRTSGFSYYMMAKVLNRGSDAESPISKPVSNVHQWKHRRERFWEDREVIHPL